MPELSFYSEYATDPEFLTHEFFLPDEAPAADEHGIFRYCSLCGHRLSFSNKSEPPMCRRHQEAQLGDGKKSRTYTSTTPCRICGGVERYKKGGACVVCQRGRVLQSLVYTGGPCAECGGTERYKANGNCRACAKKRRKKGGRYNMEGV